MKINVKIKPKDEEPIYIKTEFIKLESLMKLANLVGSGGEAKVLILDGQVKYNGEVCLMRGKKVYPGDTMEAMGKLYRVLAAS